MKTKFLLADDDADDADMFCEALMRVGPEMQCQTVDNGKSLFELLSATQFYKPDVIFLDINMPIINGWECLKGLKEDARCNDIPAIMYSTSSARKDVEKAYKLGASLFLTKPEDFGELCQILKVVAAHSGESLVEGLSRFPSVKLQ